MKHCIAFILSLVALAAQGQEKDLAYYYNQAKDAYRAKAYPRFYEMIREAHALHPYHQGVLYQLGLAAALTHHNDEAIESLKKAILIDVSFKLEGIADLNSIKDTPAFRSLLDLQKRWSEAVVHSDTALVIKDRTLHTEGIAYHEATGDFYLGSIHQRKIIKVTSKGVVTDYCPSAVQGMTSIFGIKIDPPRNLLWACSSPMAEMENFDSTARSAVFKFELSSGRLLEKIQRPAWDKDGVFGDLILNKKGEVFVSDSQTNTIFILNEKNLKLEPFFTSADFWNMQGLAFSKDERYLFIADYIKGVFRLDMKTKTLIPVRCALDVSLKGIDGLLVRGEHLIAIQNGTNPLRVMKYTLNGSNDEITGFEVIDRKHPAFNEPTLGVISGNTLYYIANSQWGGYDAQHHIKPAAQLQDIVILQSKLDRQ